MKDKLKTKLLTRKAFLRDSPLKIIGLGLALPVFAGPLLAGKKDSLKDHFTPSMAPAGPDKAYTTGDIIQLVMKNAPVAPIAKTVDTLKSGSAEWKVSGIITCMFPTIAVIEQARTLGANFIIAHEPTFYNHTDDKNWVQSNQIVEQKAKLLERYAIAVWRCHDYIHAFVPDGITYGFVRQAGWQPYYKNNSILSIPPISLEALALHLKSTLGIAGLRVIGALDRTCSKVALLPGAWGGQAQMALVEKESPDVLIVGEVHEWETAEYIRDGLKFGKKTALIVLGHSVSEEPGMAWMADWLRSQLGKLPVTHLASGSPFQLL